MLRDVLPFKVMGLRVMCSEDPQIEDETVVEGEVQSGEATKWVLRKCKVDIYCITRSIMNFSSNFFLWRCDPARVMTSSFLRFIDHTQRRSTVGRTTLDE
jgi:hypothetical protein